MNSCLRKTPLRRVSDRGIGTGILFGTLKSSRSVRISMHFWIFSMPISLVVEPVPRVPDCTIARMASGSSSKRFSPSGFVLTSPSISSRPDLLFALAATTELNSFARDANANCVSSRRCSVSSAYARFRGILSMLCWQSMRNCMFSLFIPLTVSQAATSISSCVLDAGRP